MSLREFSGSHSRKTERQRRRSSSLSSSSSSSRSSSSSSESSERRRKRDKRKRKRSSEKRERHSYIFRKLQKKTMKGEDEHRKKKRRKISDNVDVGPSPQNAEPIPKRSMAPMTREEYEKQQSKIRRVYDAETGRHRLIKGDGEVIEEIVSQERHKMINKMATLGDGASFQAYLQSNQFT
ncbi:ADP-ribosylation factor-like protein 6-interacting protein 4 isoform X2 [Actinia tenebrosa]|uniref:ADP-ribosylation factor-like protein 6-interacting protein 4 n=1 Tax=Actinia tenebrosa TaxID=6105 RepID=A0A6P8I8S1_ACTTE|nr:ADP-ribosylation factor-like protein 6-interacting protein 4 isoform X2 [Actinia tenebrosa]